MFRFWNMSVMPMLWRKPVTSKAVSAVAALLIAVRLIAVPLAGQSREAQTGCPDESALFHSCALAKAQTFNPTRTPNGEPDMQGFWRGPGVGTENIEEHPKTFDDTGGKSLIVDPVDGRVPYQPWASPKRNENREKYLEPNAACFLSGVPRTLYVPTQIQIVQSPGYVLILVERGHGYRIIPTDHLPHAGENIHLWQGDSRGHWEGNTLVVDVTNQNGKAWLDQAGNFYSDAVHMLERFTLVDADTIHYQVTIEDANVYTRPWTMVFPIKRIKQRGFELLEDACHEGEKNTPHLLGLGYKVYPGVIR